ncbi:MDR family oxidoreductase [Aestuariivirga sp.]|jgi:acrylyl-CoA reductase (NADPH)|uniref:acrylyl-CoA reductase (NADPH) n=1 Tax=Aestuariivirga sp. TaxID=2650926 RepID=UPI003783C9E5
MSFRGILITKTDSGQKAELTRFEEQDLMEGDVTVDVSHSSVNYKDGLAITGKAPIARRFPLIPGIDFAGVVRASSHPRWKAGDQVVLNGYGVGEGHHGGFAEVARVSGDWLVPVPKGWTAADCMSVGVAGYTAMLCVMALEEQGVKPADGDILVTGAAGGVGTTAIVILAKLGYRVIASTGRTSEEPFLKGLGAAGVVDRNEFNGPVKPLAKSRWAGCIDSVGSVTLANVISQMNPDATVAACGLAQGMDLPTNVAPFILRGVKLVGINSVSTPMPRRLKVWDRLVQDLDLAKLHALTTHVKLDDVPQVAADIVAGKVKGRVVVDIR